MLHDHSPESDRPALALLVDGDNISASHTKRLRDIAAKHGRVAVARVYANLSGHGNWQSAPGFRLFHAGTGKNAADLLLAIDAMELALSSGIGGFVLASSDGDFSHLALRLRELGKPVLGVGEAKTPPAFRAACERFEFLAPRPVDVPRTDVRIPNDTDRRIRDVIAAQSKNGKGMLLRNLHLEMRKEPGTRIGDLGEKTWRGYLSKKRHLFDLDPRGPEAMLRFLPEGFKEQA